MQQNSKTHCTHVCIYVRIYQYIYIYNVPIRNTSSKCIKTRKNKNHYNNEVNTHNKGIKAIQFECLVCFWFNSITPLCIYTYHPTFSYVLWFYIIIRCDEREMRTIAVSIIRYPGISSDPALFWRRFLLLFKKILTE